jgi:ABC-2 type transport system ATP-binding protein
MADLNPSVAIKVDQITKTFKLPHEKQNSLKSSLINFKKRGFEKQIALNDVSFEINKGEFFGIVGRNGSGKSTLLKMLAGIYSPTRGAIHINGTLTPFIELGVGFNPELTGRENVFLNGALLGFSRKEMSGMYNEIVEFAEIERFMDQKLKNYSSGMQVRLAFSIAIKAESDILLLDEVLAVGDAAFQQKCYDYFEDLKQDHKTVIFVSHDMSAVRRFCTRAIYIERGKIVRSGDPLEIADLYQEENMKRVIDEMGNTMDSRVNDEIKVSVVEHNTKKNNLRFRVSYQNPDRLKAYVGFSLIKDGVSIAELNSLGKENDKQTGALEYVLDTSVLNPGLYEISATLINFLTKQPLRTTKKRAKFNLSGRLTNRGGAFYLPDTWEVKNTPK